MWAVIESDAPRLRTRQACRWVTQSGCSWKERNTDSQLPQLPELLHRHTLSSRPIMELIAHTPFALKSVLYRAEKDKLFSPHALPCRHPTSCQDLSPSDDITAVKRPLAGLAQHRVEAHQGLLSRLDMARVPLHWAPSLYWWVQRKLRMWVHLLVCIKQVAMSSVCEFPL